MKTLHERLIDKQSDEELEKKWQIAKGRHSNQYWAQEWLDVAHRRAERLYAALNWDSADEPK